MKNKVWALDTTDGVKSRRPRAENSETVLVTAIEIPERASADSTE